MSDDARSYTLSEDDVARVKGRLSRAYETIDAALEGDASQALDAALWLVKLSRYTSNALLQAEAAASPLYGLTLDERRDAEQERRSLLETLRERADALATLRDRIEPRAWREHALEERLAGLRSLLGEEATS